MAKTKELKKRDGAEEGRIITSVLERAVSRERLFLFSAGVVRHAAVSSQPRVQRAFGHTRPFYDSRPQTWSWERILCTWFVEAMASCTVAARRRV